MSAIIHNPTAVADRADLTELQAVMPAGISRDGSELLLHGCKLSDLAGDYGTALYVVDVEQALDSLRAYQAAFPRVAYAGKAFLCKEWCRLLEAEGAWLDVSGGGELALALAAGFDPARVIVHGNNKTPVELVEALAASVGLIAVDSFEELARLEELAAGKSGGKSASERRQRILLRVKPGITAETHSYINTGSEDSKFGFGLADGKARLAVQQALAAEHLELLGLHMHIGSQIMDTAGFGAAIKVMCAFMSALQDELGWTAQLLDIGGGLGIAYSAGDHPLAIADFGAFCKTCLESETAAFGLAKPELMVEPGRSIIGQAGLTLYTVGTVKDLAELDPPVKYVAVDGGMSDNIRYPLYGARYESVIANKADQTRDELVTIVGKHCESGDILALDASLQHAEVGDTLCMFGTGAYCMSMSSNYNMQPRPAVLFVGPGRERIVVERETYADLFRKDV
jgi:diaminopimelate decarboxylase